jgi:hypothetical protein
MYSGEAKLFLELRLEINIFCVLLKGTVLHRDNVISNISKVKNVNLTNVYSWDSK